ncbi:hypothetical protein [Paenibacillus sp. FSL A5-0031]|uniref:hypothetical protein n=1 Tax=Paenibacillus sp. FSL A5-0031 TaxID=1920420 RepID=UPI0011858497|nr:hypothetical protein [Paenibacillus sp. FSL A5-0031]
MNRMVIGSKRMYAVLPNTMMEYKTIWCRFENGFYWFYRSQPADTAEQLVKKYNKVVQPGRRYFCFPEGFDAKLLGSNAFGPTLLQAIEDHLQRPSDFKFLRIKEQIVKLAIHHYSMTPEAVSLIEKRMIELHQQAEELNCNGTRD